MRPPPTAAADRSGEEARRAQRKDGAGQPVPRRGTARMAGSGTGHADQGQVLRPGVDLRAQARRRAHPGLRRKRRRAADDPQPARGQYHLPGGRGGAGRAAPAGVRGRRRDRRLRGQRDPVRAAATAARRGQSGRGPAGQVPGVLLPVRRAVGRRPGHPPAAAAASARTYCARPWPSTTRCGTPSTGTPTARPTSARRAAWAGKGSSPSAPTRRTAPAGPRTG